MPDYKCQNCGRPVYVYPAPRNCYCGGRVIEVGS